VELNPYATPTAALTPELAPSGPDEALRLSFLKLEQRIYRAASWFILAASSGVLAGSFYLFMGLATFMAGAFSDASWEAGFAVGFMILTLGFALVAVGVGYGFLARYLRRLDGRARVPAIVGASLLLFGFPIFTVGGAVGLWALADAQVERVLSAEYREVVARTPHLTKKPGILIPLLGPILILAAWVIVIMVLTRFLSP